MTKYSKYFNNNSASVPQTQPIFGRTDMIKNNAGGYVFSVTDWDRLDRFLILGSESNTYYQKAQALTIENATTVHKLLKVDGLRVINRVVEISESGRAPKNDPAIFVLAMATAADDVAVRQAAFFAIPRVCRTGTHLFHFAENVEKFRGWGRGLRNAVANWYNSKDIDDLQYSVMKYRQRDGWSNRDLLRLSHPKTDDEVRNTLYNWIVKNGETNISSVPELARLAAAEKALRTTDAKEAVKLITEYNLPHETINKTLLNDAGVWSALLQHMPMTAMIRNLGKMSSVGILTKSSDNEKRIIDALSNKEHLKKSRVHPFTLLVALKIYEQGHGERGTNSWRVNRRIVDALNDAFYAAFDNIEPTGKNHLLGIDVSSSMTIGSIAGMTGISPNCAAAAMAMVTARTEQNYLIRGFCHTLVDLKISPKMDLNQVMKKTQNSSFGGTDCAATIHYAIKNKIPVEVFIIYTDNETWHGQEHTSEMLKKYRDKTGIPAKLIAVGFTATKSSIADPNDTGMLDFIGFDTAAPALMSDFIRNG